MEVKLCIAKEARRKSNIEALEIKYGGIGMTLKEILEAGGGILFVVLTLVQVAPIKVNPWTVLGPINWSRTEQRSHGQNRGGKR